MSTLYKPSVGDEVADLLESVDIMDLVEDHKGEYFIHAWDTTKQVYCHWVMIRNL